MNAREIATNIIINIIKDGKYNNLALKEAFLNNDISTKDKAFITEIVNGTIRNLIYIDYIIDKFSKTKTKKMKPIILNLLRISVYQLKYMDKVPANAICNDAVEIIKKGKYRALSGFLNGVIRNIARNIDNIELPKKEDDKSLYLQTKYSYQKWTIDKLLEQMPYEDVQNICIANNEKPSVCICINTMKTTKQKLKKMLEDDGMIVKDATISENMLYISKTKNIAKSRAFREGLFHIMGESSAICVEILGAEKCDTIIDACACPGGKSFYISHMTNGKASILARDIHKHKIELMQKMANRLSIKNIKIEEKDATKFFVKDEETADKILLDVPCSGFGIVRKKPDIKYTKTKDDIKSLSKLQKDILEACHKYVKKGGTLVYSTCTLFEEENIENVMWLCEKYGFSLQAITTGNEKIDNIPTAKDGYITILPNKHSLDGFFIAKLKRID